MKAHVVVREGKLCAVLEDNTEIESDDPMALADRLYAAGVFPGEVTMPDWRAGNTAPHGGLKIALFGRLHELAKTRKRPA